MTKNEEKNITRAITSIKLIKVIPSIVLIDDFSTDNTASLAHQLGATTIQHPLNGDYATQRNYALTQCDTNWVLFLDADEEITPALAQEIESIPDNANESAFLVKRLDSFWNTKMFHGEAGNAFVPRLVHKSRGTFVRAVHEEWKSTIPSRALKGILNHYPHPTLKEFITEVNTYSTSNASYLLRMGRTTSWFDILFTPFVKFFYTYFIKSGFLDGAAGFAYSFLMSFHSFLTRAKLYMLRNP